MSNPKGNEASLKKFKPKWNKGATQPIRVPTAIVTEVLDYAHKLDELPAQVNQSIVEDDEGEDDEGEDDYLNDETESDLDRVIKDQARNLETLVTDNRMLKREAQQAKETLAQVIEVLEVTLAPVRFTKERRIKVMNEVLEPLKTLLRVL